MAKFYTLEVPEMMRKIFIDYHIKIYTPERLGRYKGSEGLGGIQRKNKKQELEDQLKLATVTAMSMVANL